MENNENKKAPEELTDEALDQVAGGYYTADEFFKYATFVSAFKSRNVCNHCNTNFNNCLLKLDVEEIYNMFGGDNNATCPDKT